MQRSIKKQMKKWHDKKDSFQGISRQLVLLFNLRLKLFSEKLYLRWLCSFKIIKAFPHGVVDLKDSNSNWSFEVNEQRLKPYLGEESKRLTKSINLITTWRMECQTYDIKQTHIGRQPNIISFALYSSFFILSLFALKKIVFWCLVRLKDQKMNLGTLFFFPKNVLFLCWMHWSAIIRVWGAFNKKYHWFV